MKCQIFEDLSMHELISVYDSSRVFVFPSQLEGFGLPFIEARSRNLTVVANRLEVFDELAARVGGYIVDIEDREKFAMQLRRASDEQREKHASRRTHIIQLGANCSEVFKGYKLSAMILLVANTIVGKAGNIGFRLAQIVRYGELPDSSIVIVARGLTDEIGAHPSVHLHCQSPFALIQRGINSLRKSFLPKFNSRRWDIYLFNIFFVYSYYTRLRYEEYEAVLLCETSAFIMKFLKKRGLDTILDVPIAPQKHIIDCLGKDARTKTKLHYFCWLSNQEETCF